MSTRRPRPFQLLKFTDNTPRQADERKDRRRRRPDSDVAVEPERLVSLTFANKIKFCA
jgi:hypothetical protein